jgi:hypothetical protein
MSTITAMTDPSTGYHAAPWPESLLTRQQMQTVERLPAGHEFVGILGRTPIVRQPDGHLSRMRTGGRLVKTEGVQAVQSYLLVQG